MGTFQQTMEVSPLAEDRFERLDALVDTGATYSWVPSDVLERLGVEPDDSWPFVLADGTEKYYRTAWVKIRLDGKTQFSICIFGEPGTQPLLGSFTLEAFRLGVDAVNKRLIPTPGLLL